ncbi:MAG: hydroxymethylbilane synthase [Nitrospirota bacterium]
MNAAAAPLVIGTRGSMLARWQAEWVKARLQAAHPGLDVSLTIIKTTGDKILDVPLAKVGGKGLFVKEIEEALLDGSVDLAVHSMKDVPTALPAALHLTAVPRREEPFDALLSRDAVPLAKLPAGAVIGTSSLRRQAQLLAHRPDLTIVSLRGNLDTRLRKVTDGAMDAIVLAAAGLRRLGWADRITEVLPPAVCLPAIGQGALGIECRREDARVNALARALDDPDTRACVDAERAFLTRLEGGCQVPIAAHAALDGDRLTLDGLIAGVRGERVLRESMTGARQDGPRLGRELAERLLTRGGEAILREVYAESD